MGFLIVRLKKWLTRGSIAQARDGLTPSHKLSYIQFRKFPQSTAADTASSNKRDEVVDTAQVLISSEDGE